ncbi:haloacid dehalogenase type II [Saccharopolyspora sp. HNM0983]|uniref:Haloacid dehalogenase type II n=1 Tax=Saccharopolyspora montiporae TaxID=2781240 RepID=A0A929BEE6_9PSEU|nr:haloacid dehalogenase type II [Saccharopolyspora sp. HNM0983]MBE9375972.1 haloacid dehalogenase type II [Saccharopolyspora sp. HNM0983]
MPVEGVRVVAFDVFGTAVDWRTGVARAVAAAAARRGAAVDEWAFADAWRERYHPALGAVRSGRREWVNLDRLHRESLDELLDRFDVGELFDDRERRELVRSWHRLPPWPDVGPGLERLRADRTVAALSNGGYALLTTLAKHAGLPVDAVLSAELAGTYKPDPHVYRTAARLLDVRPDEMLLVAAHHWDIEGARAVGLRTAFLERPLEKGPHGLPDRAVDVTSDLAVTGFTELAEHLAPPAAA